AVRDCVVGSVGDRGGFADIVVAVGLDDRVRGGDGGKPPARCVVGVAGGVDGRGGLPHDLRGGGSPAEVVVRGLVGGAGGVGDGQRFTVGVVGGVGDAVVGGGGGGGQVA